MILIIKEIENEITRIPRIKIKFNLELDFPIFLKFEKDIFIRIRYHLNYCGEYLPLSTHSSIILFWILFTISILDIPSHGSNILSNANNLKK